MARDPLNLQNAGISTNGANVNGAKQPTSNGKQDVDDALYSSNTYAPRPSRIPPSKPVKGGP